MMKKRSIAVGILSGQSSILAVIVDNTIRSSSGRTHLAWPKKRGGTIPRARRMGGGGPPPRRTAGDDDDTTAIVECDPEATAEADAADVGVLGCSSSIAGEICVANALSTLGGFCYPPIASYTRVCDATSSYFNTDCDCSAFDTETQTGSIVCLQLTQNAGSMFYGCYNVTALDFDKNSFENGRYSARGTCREFVMSNSGGDGTTTTSRQCIELHSTYGGGGGGPSSFNSSSCELYFDGQACTSCILSGDFPAWPNPSNTTWKANCSNVVNGLIIADLTDLPMIQACSTPVVDGTVCDLCHSSSSSRRSDGTRIFYSDNTVISLEGFGTSLTCGELLKANHALQLSSDKCVEAAAVAQAQCCVYAWYVTHTKNNEGQPQPATLPNMTISQ